MRRAGNWGPRRTLIGFDIDSGNSTFRLREGEVVGDRLTFGKLYEQFTTMVLEVRTVQQVRGHIEHSRSPEAMWRFLTGPIDF